MDKIEELKEAIEKEEKTSHAQQQKVSSFNQSYYDYRKGLRFALRKIKELTEDK